VDEDVLGEEAVSAWLEREHQLEVAAAEADDGVGEAERTGAELIGQLGELALGVDPEDQAALAV
jgi:hypothetical protein